MTTKKRTYDSYAGTAKIEAAAHALLDAISVVDNNTAMTIQSAEKCPRCSEHLKEIRIDPKFIRLLCFCPGCHWFLLFDRIGRIKTFTEHETTRRPLTIPPRPSPRRPLERMIHNHLQNIKKDTKL